MSDSSIYSSTTSVPEGAPLSAERATVGENQPWLLSLITRLHFYIGLFVGPFLLIAALSGIVYALTPQLEDILYKEALYSAEPGPALPLAEQIAVAQAAMGPHARLEAIRPAPYSGTTTRVMFGGDDLGPSENHAVFLDPASGDVRAILDVYGTSGVLPLRSFLDRFHRGLLLGDFGRLYSELAASWLWILAVGGLALWWDRRRRRMNLTAHGSPRHSTAPQRLRRWHGTLGAWSFIGLLFFSVTGLTWSNYAGSNIGVLRAHYGWGTPSVTTDLPAEPVGSFAEAQPKNTTMDEHAHHRAAPTPANGTAQTAAVDLAMYDAVLKVAREAGINAGKLEIRPPRGDGKAWTVTEIDRSWPTQVDAVSVDPRNLSIVDRTEFSSFPLAAKLTRWGIDAHMGALFGLPNQLILIAMAGCLIVMVVWGYMMWWHRRPALRSLSTPYHGALSFLRGASWLARACLLAVAIAIGVFLPVMGVSLVGFLLLDCVLQRIRRT